MGGSGVGNASGGEKCKEREVKTYIKIMNRRINSFIFQF